MKAKLHTALLVILVSWPSCGMAQLPDEYPMDLKKHGIVVPAIDGDEVSEAIKSPDTIFYRLPKAWQHYVPATRIEHRNLTTQEVTYSNSKKIWGIYTPQVLQSFNANLDFPWEGTVGLNTIIQDGEDGVHSTTVNFLSLPFKNGKRRPVLVFWERPIKWIFPEGTIIGELILSKNNGQWWVQEVRMRKKMPGSVAWEPIIQRPVATYIDLVRLAKLPEQTPAKKYMHFRNPEEEEVFLMRGLVERLPPLEPHAVRHLLSLPFKDVTYVNWSDASMAPTSDQDFSLVPRDYSFGLLSPDQHTCSNCHKQTQTSVPNLIPREPSIQQNFAKVGNIRGSDTVFTWHPWTTESIQSAEGTQELARIRDFDSRNDVVTIWDATKMRVTDYPDYLLTEFVQTSLKSYELPPAEFLHH